MQRSDGDKEIKRGIYTLNKPLERIKETVFLTSLQVTALLLDEEDLTTIITRTPFSLALLLTAAKSCMCVQNFRFNIAIFVLFFFFFAYLSQLILSFFCNIFLLLIVKCFILIVHPSSFRCPSFLLSLSTLQGRAPSRSGLPLKKKKNHQFTWRIHSLSPSVCFSCGWPAPFHRHSSGW